MKNLVIYLILLVFALGCSSDKTENSSDTIDSTISIYKAGALVLESIPIGSIIEHPENTIGKIKACDPEGHGITFEIIGRSKFAITEDGYMYIPHLSTIRPREYKVLVRATDDSSEKLWTEQTIKITVK